MLKLALLLLLTSPADQFDLACSGTLTTTSYDGKAAKPYSSHFRIDLAQGEWCEAECKARHAFANVGPTQLTLQDAYNADLRARIRSYINRETGEHLTLSTGGRGTSTLMMEWKGTCEKMPFSGFPEFKTKF